MSIPNEIETVLVAKGFKKIEPQGVARVVAYDFLDDQTLISMAKEIAERSNGDPYLIVKGHSAALPIITSGVCNSCGQVQANMQVKVCEACGLSFMLTLYIGY